MDGFVQNEGIIVIGATNKRDNLDSALTRPGRFDVEIKVSRPDLAGREDIFQFVYPFNCFFNFILVKILPF